MNALLKYKNFFALRDEYPEHRQLLAELMSFAFQNKDSFCQMTYLNGNFKEEDVLFVFKKLNLPIPEKVISTNLRNVDCTIIHFATDIQLLP